MGPCALFDKSFLQSLSEDEALWFDHFFTANVCPLFFVETLADLQKSKDELKRPAEREVQIIASKTPTFQGAPNVHHRRLCYNELLGNPVPMTGQIVIAEGKVSKDEKGYGVYVPVSPEAEAFSRWKDGLFDTIERDQAKGWRDALNSVDLPEMASASKKLLEELGRPSSLNDAWRLASDVFNRTGDKFRQIGYIIRLMKLDGRDAHDVMKHWSLLNNPFPADYAPYCTHVGTVDMFFRISIASGLISAQRASNQVDIAYLYYLPFCHTFISSDKLHRKSALGALRKDQTFQWGPDLKLGLKEVNDYYAAFPEETKQKGIMSFAHRPPTQLVNNSVAAAWDRHIPSWRNSVSTAVFEPRKSEGLKRHLQAIIDGKAESVPPGFSSDDAEGMVLKREFTARRGSWQIIDQKVVDEQADIDGEN